MALEWQVCINFAKPKERERERERERDKCFVAPISFQQRTHFIAIRAFSDLASQTQSFNTSAHMDLMKEAQDQRWLGWTGQEPSDA